MWKFIAIVAALAVAVTAQHVHDGVCRTDVEVVQDFDLEKYMGKWFEIKRYDVYFQRGSECSQAVYTKNEDGTVAVENSSIKNGNPRSTTTGSAVLASETGEGKLSVAFNNKTPGTEANYWILGTDYENYSIVWNCHNLRNGKSADVAWILSRTPTLNVDVEVAVNGIVERYLDQDKLKPTAQDAETCGY